MLLRVEQVLGEWLASGARGIGQVLIVKSGDGFALCHRDDEASAEFEVFRSPDDAVEIARLDDAGKYRPLRTAPKRLKRCGRLSTDSNCLESSERATNGGA